MSISVYLTQLKLSATNWAVQADLDNRYRLHRQISQAFVGYHRDENRVLWRLERTKEGHQILVQSQLEPNWRHLQEIRGYLSVPPRVKLLTVSLEPGQRLRFRLDANPTRRNRTNKTRQETGKSAVTTPISPEDRITWLGSQLEKYGFQMLAGGEKESYFLKLQKDRHADEDITLLWSWFEGLLSVNDPKLAEQGLLAGVGRGKAFGLGMLSLALAA